jgi:hypothetical protein
MERVMMTASFEHEGNPTLTITEAGDFELKITDVESYRVTVTIPGEAIDRLRDDQAARRARQSLKSETTQ